ncbi:hypothetical protein TWF788_003237 [Orbilia oligospora]|uniref:Uncharacterized protein n=1 Tax=Orbilia oligospora TaxID=2813651 RepID=A0A7C8TYJ3_ORBOL|nr:hypothetical protein TWF788_003237 [Orbilia oligospora]
MSSFKNTVARPPLVHTPQLHASVSYSLKLLSRVATIIKTSRIMGPYEIYRENARQTLKPLSRCQTCKPLSVIDKVFLSQIHRKSGSLTSSVEKSLVAALQTRFQRHQNELDSTSLLPGHFFDIEDPTIRFEFMAIVIRDFPELLNCAAHSGPDIRYFRQAGWRPSSFEEFVTEMFANAALCYIFRISEYGHDLFDMKDPEIKTEIFSTVKDSYEKQDSVFWFSGYPRLLGFIPKSLWRMEEISMPMTFEAKRNV